MGPFEKLGNVNSSPSKSSVILQENTVWTAPGHNAIFTDATGNDWIFYHAINAKDPGHNDTVPNDDYTPRVLLMDPITYVDGWPQIPGGSPTYKEQSVPSVAIGLFPWIW
jgi:arabinan endo-1,5-alpha-L-arabinosidase